MDKRKNEASLSLGVFGRRTQGRRSTAAEAIAGGLSLVWLLASGFLLVRIDEPIQGAMFVAVIVAVILPVALLWVAASAVRATRLWKDDVARLQGEINALRQAYVAQNQISGMAVKRRQGDTSEVVERLETQPVASDGGHRPESDTPASARPTLTTVPPATIKPAPSVDQSSLALEAPGTEPKAPLSPDDFIRALNFPDDERDRDGFRALRLALENREAAKLVRASQDVLTLLSQDGIYMDDLLPDRAKTEVWRRFAEGERGKSIAAVGGIRDRSALALVAARMKEDIIFRDAAHHFLRHFDRTFSAFAPLATDQEIGDLAETRTARAFMLLGRATGTFD